LKLLTFEFLVVQSSSGQPLSALTRMTSFAFVIDCSSGIFHQKSNPDGGSWKLRANQGRVEPLNLSGDR
jgi:hypothetical protein